MKPILLCFLLFIAANCLAQQHYIVTIQNDTLYGKVTRGNLRSNYVKIKSNSGAKKFHLKEIKEWKNGDMPVIVVPDTTKSRKIWLELLVEVQGRAQLLRDLEFVFESNIHHIGFNGQHILITEKNLNYVWSKWMKCKQFRNKYRYFYKKHIDELAQRHKMPELITVINYYNANCQAPTEAEFTFNIRVGVKTHISLLKNVAYIVRNGYLVRQTYNPDNLFSNGKPLTTDSVVFNYAKQQELKAYCIKNWHNYREAEPCKHVAPVSAGLHFRDEEVSISGYFGPCRAIAIPQKFLAAQQYLETFFEREKKPVFKLDGIPIEK